MKKIDFTSKVAALFLAILFLSNDLIASANAIINSDFVLTNGNSLPHKSEVNIPASRQEKGNVTVSIKKKDSHAVLGGASEKDDDKKAGEFITTQRGDFKVWPRPESKGTGEVFSLSKIDMPDIPGEIQVVSRNGGGYKYQAESNMPVRISISVDNRYDLAKLSNTLIYYYDPEKLQWLSVMPSDIDYSTFSVEGVAPGNTNYFAGLISTPEMPQANAFVPTAVSGIQAASPVAGINMMQPPSASRTGDAAISYPLIIPAGRHGMTPNVNLSYSSGRGTGWLGVGWDIDVPAITIDTRWGTPTFPGLQEEVYLFNGSPLVEEGGSKGNRNPGTRQTGDVRFFERSTQEYKEIVRKGTDPSNYRWVVKTADNKKYYFGTVDGTAFDLNSVLASNDGIVKWYLKKVEDRWGNYITYNYNAGEETSATGVTNGGAYVVLSEIKYTGYGTDQGNYSVVFETTTGRKDATVSLKAGVKELDYHKLNKVKVLYDGVESKNYQFVYDEGDFGKTILWKIEEYRSDKFFNRHVLDYYDAGLTYSAGQSITYDSYFNDFLQNMPDEVKTVAGPISSYVRSSLLNTSVSYGWGAGGSIGVGVGPGPKPKNSKTWTFSGHLGYSQTYGRRKVFLDDFNGDGLPDLVIDRANSVYRPLQNNGVNGFGFGPSLSINYNDKLFKSKGVSYKYGLDFVTPFDIFYYGANWVKTNNETNTYLTDYNADGLKDLVNGPTVKFGELSATGELSFNNSSEMTPNPVIKGEPAVQPSPGDPLKDLEIVRIWQAPMDGDIDIVGTATLSSASTEGASVGIQHNGSFEVNMTSLEAGGSTDMSTTSSIWVNKGEYIMFRTHSNGSGHGDFVTWNPEISYQNTQKIDANGIDYTSSTYEDGFLLSAGQGVTFQGNQAVEIDWPALPSGIELSDQVLFKIRITYFETATGDEIGEDVYQYVNEPGNLGDLQGVTFSKVGDGTSAPFIGSLSVIPDVDPGSFCNLSFEVYSNSNVDWKGIEWRPEVKFGDDPCGEPKKSVYPTVYYHTYNRVVQLDGPWTSIATGTSTHKMRTWPVIDFSRLGEAFTSDELNEQQITKDAYFVTKSGGGLLSKMLLRVKADGSYDFYEIPQPGEPLSQLSLTGSSSKNSFNRGEIVNQELYVGFFSENKKLADFLNNHTSAVRLYNLSQGTALVGSSSAFNIFSVDRTDLQDNYLHWGQFCWSNEAGSISEIDPAELQMDRTMAMENDFSQNPPEEASDVDGLINEQSSTPLDQQFGMLIPTRGEQQNRIPDLIYTSYANGLASRLDRWSAWGTYSAAYSFNGGTAPGKFGEPEPEPVSSPVSGTYTAEAIALKSESKSFANNLTAGYTPPTGFGANFGYSRTTDNPNKYYSQTLTSFMDINGDGYPDILKNEKDSKEVQITRPTGGFGDAITTFMVSNKSIGKSVAEEEGYATTGKFINEDAKFQNISVNAGANFSTTKAFYEWVDVNGDGLKDRIDKSTDMVELNYGTGLLSPVSLLDPSSVSKSFALNLGGSLGQFDEAFAKEGGGFSGGIGINRVESFGEKVLMDINGDGLNDILTVNNGDINVQINLGTTWENYIDLTNKHNEINESIGIYANIAGSMGIYVAPILSVAHLKISLSGNLQGNYAVSRLREAFRDMNGDGIMDYVIDDGGLGAITVHYGQAGKGNLLKEVINPLGGGFELDYKQVGGRYGNYPIEVKIHNSDPDELMVWDMPFSKYVMSHLTIKDGLEMEDVANNDIDGADQVEYFFNYDGGIKSRRERDFIGFTRIETRSTDDPELLPGTTAYNTSVVDFARPISNNPQYRRRFEYLKGQPMYSYSLYHKEYMEGRDPRHDIFLKSQTKYTYEPRSILLAGTNKGQVEYDGEDAVVVNWSTVGETESIFLALKEKEEVSIPIHTDINSFHATLYQISYDELMNVTRYSREGSDEPEDAVSQLVGVINESHYEYYTKDYQYSDLFSGNYPFNNPTIDPDNGSYCFTVDPQSANSQLVDYELLSFCVPGYQMQPPNPCSNPSAYTSDNSDFQLTFRKLVNKSIDIVETSFNTTWMAPLIADMTYFPYGSGANEINRSNAIHRHKVFIGSRNATGFRRGTSVVLDASENAPGQILSLKDFNGSDSTITDLVYNTYGNVTSLTGPENHAGQRFSTDYSYDSDNHQFVIAVDNDYGDAGCFKYDFPTGNLLRQVDINGHATAYVYDDFFRLKDVYAPREYENASSAPTMSFAYYIDGISLNSSDWREKVPVAITTHNMGVSADLNSSPPATDCITKDNFSARPAISTGMKTANFVDGLGKVVQVKKEAAIGTSGSNLTHNEVSGIEVFDDFGRNISVSIATTEASSETFGKLNNAKSAVDANTWEYNFPYPQRVERINSVRETGNGTSLTTFAYGWTGGDQVFPTNHFTIETEYEGLINVVYKDSEGNSVATLQPDDEIITEFNYDRLGQMLSTTDPMGQVTSYSYDKLGRLIQENHPDRGQTDYNYDNAGNLRTTVTDNSRPSASTTMNYHYNRLVSRYVYGNVDSYNVVYGYGKDGDGLNGAGRVVSVTQGNMFLTEDYAYDELGNLVSEDKEIWIPNGGRRNYRTTFKYDSWGRMREIKYPDNEIVGYNYLNTGELASIRATNQGGQFIVKELLYDNFGNIKSLKYGNGTETVFDYDDNTQRLTHVDLETSNSAQILDKVYSYDARGNVESVVNNAGIYTPVGNGNPLGGTYQHIFQYDSSNRLENTISSEFNGQPYSLVMDYDLAGSITKKTQSFGQGGNYDFTYHYHETKKHQLTSIGESGGDEYGYTYDSNAGRVVNIEKNNSPEIAYAWNELDQIRGAGNSAGIYHFMYDHTGERVLKGTLRNSNGSINGEPGEEGFILDAYTYYLNPYYVVNVYNSTEEASKHYYMGSQRVATAQINYTITHVAPPGLTPGDESTPGSITDLDNVVSEIQDQFGLELNLDYRNLLEPNDYSAVFPFEDYQSAVEEQECETDQCRCEQSIYWATQDGFQCSATKVMYWYHPDYLGNVEFITKANGSPHQFFWYSPWGEPLVEQYIGQGSFASRYKFNGKEQDIETGDYYYGARYYNAKFSHWLSVDPLMGNNSSLTPYNFVANNPIRFIDPDGMDHWEVKNGIARKIDSKGDDIFVNGVRIDRYDFSSQNNQQALSTILSHYYQKVGRNQLYDNSVSILNYDSDYRLSGSACWDSDDTPYQGGVPGLLAAYPKRRSGLDAHRIIAPLDNGKLSYTLANKFNLMSALIHEDVHITQNQTVAEYSGGKYGYLKSAWAESEAYSHQMNNRVWNQTTEGFRSYMLNNFNHYLNTLQPAVGFGNRSQYEAWRSQHKEINNTTSYRNARFL